MSDYKEIIVKEYRNEKGLITRREVGDELVRCKDCKFNTAVEHNPICGIFGVPMDMNDYCSYGERKDE